MAICKTKTVWTGNTYAIRNEIKSLGGVWDAAKKAWVVPALSMSERAKVSAMYAQLRGVTIKAA